MVAPPDDLHDESEVMGTGSKGPLHEPLHSMQVPSSTACDLHFGGTQFEAQLGY
jgi:hypothetical protein